MLYINPDECIDCRACEPVCPVEAIYSDEELPEQFRPYRHANAEFFTKATGLGSPGGAATVGAVDADHELIDALPIPQTSSGSNRDPSAAGGRAR
jgi:ferredoxin